MANKPQAKESRYVRTENKEPQALGVELLRSLGETDEVNLSIAFDPSGQTLASSSNDGSVMLWNVGTGRLIRTLTGHSDSVFTVVFDPSGRFIITGSRDRSIKIWEVATGNVRHSIEAHKNSVINLAFDPAGRFFASVSFDSSVKLWNFDTGKLIRTFIGHWGIVMSAQFHPGGRILASAGHDQTIRLWDVTSGRQLKVLRGHESFVYSVAFDRSGNVLASGGYDRTVRLWDFSSGELLHTLEGHTSAVEGVTFSADGRLLASKSDDGTAVLWDSKTLGAVAVLPEPSFPDWWIPGIAFHPLTDMLATIGSKPNAGRNDRSKLIHLWNLDLNVLLRQHADEHRAHNDGRGYALAKIVMLGEPGFGKSGLGWRLKHGEFKAQDSVHDPHLWMLEMPNVPRVDGQAILWDLASDPDSALIGSFLLGDVDLALIVIDPTRSATAFAEVKFWMTQLEAMQSKRHMEQPPDLVGERGSCPAILVGARSDIRIPPSMTNGELEDLCKTLGISGGYVTTSALTGEGVEGLLELMSSQIQWEKLPVTHEPPDVQIVKDYILSLIRNRRRKVIITVQALHKRLDETVERLNMSEQEVLHALMLLSDQGYVQMLGLNDGQHHVLLTPQLLTRLAAAFFAEARRSVRLGLLDEMKLLTDGYSFQELKDLSRKNRKVILEAAVKMLVEHRLCIRKPDPSSGTTYLVFVNLILEREMREKGLPRLSYIDVTEADRKELAARDELAKFDYTRAREILEETIASDQGRSDRIRAEFGFLWLLANEEETAARLKWCTEVWRVLSLRNPYTVSDFFPVETASGDSILTSDVSEDVTESNELSSTSRSHAESSLHKPSSSRGKPLSPERKGEQLETAVMRLFRTFFRIGSEVPWKIRQQKRGTQSGFDISLEWSGKYDTVSELRSRCHIECKNYQDPITTSDIAEKLLSEPRRNSVIEHWILISPYANPSNELNRFLEQQENERTFPFQVQIWCPETGILELFGLEPEVFEAFFDAGENELYPRTWDKDRIERVRSNWRSRLNPPLRLPRGWESYMREPALLCIHKEIAQEMDRDYQNFIPMNCHNLAGTLLERPLESYVEDWLEDPSKHVLFLLGEFGDGKSFFTYVLARHLVSRWLASSRKWMPLRLALSNYPGNSREFLRQRLEEFDADIAGWREVGTIAQRLVILDGFDEISVKLDPETVTQNIKDLLECVQEFEGCKILITSRTHFFQRKKDAQRLLERLGLPPVYSLAPIQRNNVLAHLSLTVPDITRQQALLRLKSMNDPIGLARKPLFLEMLKDVLGAPDLPQDLDVVTLYEKYIEQSLTRKLDLLDDPDLQTRPEETLANLRKIMGEIAEELQRTGDEYVCLTKFQSAERKPFAELLWQLTSENELNQDATSRVGARSLLARVQRDDIEEEWPVDFCHRSMREYFVSIRLCQAIEEGEDTGSRFLKEIPLNHEILEFAATKWRTLGPSVENKLLSLISMSVVSENPGRMGGYAITLLYKFKSQLPSDFDWSGKIFDGADMEEADFSGLNFRGSSFRNANLANVNFEDSIFEESDLSGVRLEETAHVVAISKHLSAEHLLAVYADDSLRDWHLKPGRKMVSRVVGSVPLQAPAAVGVHESGQPWMRIGQEWLFFTIESDGTWSLVARFPIKDSIDDPTPRGMSWMTLIERKGEDDLHVKLIDLSQQVSLASAVAKVARYGRVLGTEALVWSDSKNGVRVRFLRPGKTTEIVLPSAEPSCVDTLTVRDGQHLIGIGTSEGRVCVWALDLQNQEWVQRKLLDMAAHDGPVTAVAFQTGRQLASGSSDRSIALLGWEEGESGIVERRLVLKLRCKGMKIKALKTETERRQLQRLIEESEFRMTAD